MAAKKSSSSNSVAKIQAQIAKLQTQLDKAYLRESERKYRTLVDNLNVWIHVLDNFVTGLNWSSVST